MAGLVPAIDVFALLCCKDMDARHKLTLGPAKGRTRVAGHDESKIRHFFAGADGLSVEGPAAGGG